MNQIFPELEDTFAAEHIVKRNAYDQALDLFLLFLFADKLVDCGVDLEIRLPSFKKQLVTEYLNNGDGNDLFPKSFKRLSVRYSRDFVPQKTKNILVSVFSFVLAWTLSRLSPRNKPDQNRFVGLTYWKTSFPIHYRRRKEFLASLIGGQNHKVSFSL